MKLAKKLLEDESARITTQVGDLNKANEDDNEVLLKLNALSGEFSTELRNVRGKETGNYLKKRLAEIDFDIERLKATMGDRVEKINALTPQIQELKFALKAIETVRF